MKSHFPRFILFIALALLSMSVSAGAYTHYESIHESDIDLLLRKAMEDGLVAGGVVLVGDNRRNIFFRAYGRVSGVIGSKPVQQDTMFDVASLTKVVATAPAVMKLVEKGAVRLDDPVSKWLPELSGVHGDDLLIMHLLTHTSGLRDIAVLPQQSISNFIERAAGLASYGTPGSTFKYADINFILLGELVKRVTGLSLDAFAAANLFAPLGMVDTRFNPGPEVVERCAATLDYENSCLFGIVQDRNAYHLGGVAGHAGLFSTALDLSLFCRMILNGGTFNGRHVFGRETLSLATIPYSCHGGKVLRGLGWDVDSPLSSPKTAAFSRWSFGHTGYSGCSLWIDPEENLFVLFLSSRLDFKRKKEFNRLRGDISAVAARLVGEGREMEKIARKSE